jgi:hypothetical protein
MRRIIQLPASNERLGNQLFRYAYARKLSELYDAELECDPWSGLEAFEGVHYSGMTEPGVQLSYDEAPPAGFTCVRLHGRFMRQEHLIYTRSEVRRWFKIREIYQNVDLPRGYVAAHLRRGDYERRNSPFILLKESAYQRAMEKNGHSWEDCWKVREENPNLSQLHPTHLAFLNDFQILMNADVLYRANSTFSWWAAVLGKAKVFSPEIYGLSPGWQHVEFLPGNDCDFVPSERWLTLKE